MLVSGADLGIGTIRQLKTAAQDISLRRNPNNTRVSSYPANKYNTVRGILCEKDNLDNILLFQFNPTEVRDVKNNEWVTLNDLGFSGSDYLWAKGGERNISFELWFDATAGSNTPLFRRAPYGNPGYDTLKDLTPRGTLHDTEVLTSFQYPIQASLNEPRYSSGGVVPSTRFMPPPIVVFVYGDLYLECIVDTAEVSHILFNEELIPIRSKATVKLNVLETEVVRQNLSIRNKNNPRTLA